MEKKIDKLLFASCCYAYFINGMLVLMTSSILTYLMKDYALSYQQSGLFVSIQATGSLVAGLLSGVIMHQLGRKRSMFLVATLFAVGFGGIIFTSQAMVLYLLIFLTGLGWGINNNLVNILGIEASNGNSGYTNILHMSFAVGAFISPLMIRVFVKWGISWKIPVAIVSMASMSLFVIFSKMSVGTTSKDVTTKEKLSFNFLQDPRYYVYMMILFTYVGAERGLNSWRVFIQQL